MPKKKRRGGFNQPGAAEVAADRRWSMGSTELAEEQQEGSNPAGGALPNFLPLFATVCTFLRHHAAAGGQ